MAFLLHFAHKLFNIPVGHNDLLAWSCHSTCVTAANVLHHARFSDSYTKNHLRWCSNTFLRYLHNTFNTANQHTKAITLGLPPGVSLDHLNCMRPSSVPTLPNQGPGYQSHPHLRCTYHFNNYIATSQVHIHIFYSIKRLLHQITPDVPACSQPHLSISVPSDPLTPPINATHTLSARTQCHTC
jgi:hypothetical protein